MKKWSASAPANIAIIKYMGKNPGNIPTNGSLSLTLADFVTKVELEIIKDNSDQWEALPSDFPIASGASKKFMAYFQSLKEKFRINESFIIRSGNNFPADAGVASSASSFAALTKVACQAFTNLSNTPLLDIQSQASLSRTGSGSSCRSFLGPWCVWEGDKIFQPKSTLVELVDILIIVDRSQKSVSSSNAHQKIRTSPLFSDRPERANQRLKSALNALENNNFQTLAKISWEEFWDMHSLFHTSQPPFFYFTPHTLTILKAVEDWTKDNIFTIATIDAGPNVHLLIPKTELSQWLIRLKNLKTNSQANFEWMISNAAY